MEWPIAARQLLVFIHLLAFAVALSDVLREDWQVLVSRHLDGKRLAATARRVSWTLALLWVTGITLVGMEVGSDLSLLAGKPKLVMKLIVVSVLTVNGGLLHALALPALSGRRTASRSALALAPVLGAVSTVSWLFASFTGAARVVAPYLRLPQYLGLYFAALAAGVAVGWFWVRPRLAGAAPAKACLGRAASGAA